MLVRVVHLHDLNHSALLVDGHNLVDRHLWMKMKMNMDKNNTNEPRSDNGMNKSGFEMVSCSTGLLVHEARVGGASLMKRLVRNPESMS